MMDPRPNIGGHRIPYSNYNMAPTTVLIESMSFGLATVANIKSHVHPQYGPTISAVATVAQMAFVQHPHHFPFSSEDMRTQTPGQIQEVDRHTNIPAPIQSANHVYGWLSEVWSPSGSPEY